ncbi:MAG: D-aminoacyl-tRNA deacylase [Phycisphaerae bacterium]
MRALIQRVLSASVSVDSQVSGRIERGLLVYLGVAIDDTVAQADKLAEKVARLRIFEDQSGKLNLSVDQVDGAILVIPNFTLQADARKGRRPSFDRVMPGESAELLHRRFIETLSEAGIPVQEGQFGADMRIASVADGPVNLVVDIEAG